MKKLLLSILALSVVMITAQVVTQTNSGTLTKTRELTNVNITFEKSGKLRFTGDLRSVVRFDGVEVSYQSLGIIDLSDEELDTILLAQGLPTQATLKSKFSSLFEAAWQVRNP